MNKQETVSVLDTFQTFIFYKQKVYSYINSVCCTIIKATDNSTVKKPVTVVYDYFLTYVSSNTKNQFLFPEYQLARE